MYITFNLLSMKTEIKNINLINYLRKYIDIDMRKLTDNELDDVINVIIETDNFIRSKLRKANCEKERRMERNNYDILDVISY
jgi:hypothetical protein